MLVLYACVLVCLLAELKVKPTSTSFNFFILVATDRQSIGTIRSAQSYNLKGSVWQIEGKTKRQGNNLQGGRYSRPRHNIKNQSIGQHHRKKARKPSSSSTRMATLSDEKLPHWHYNVSTLFVWFSLVSA